MFVKWDSEGGCWGLRVCQAPLGNGRSLSLSTWGDSRKGVGCWVGWAQWAPILRKRVLGVLWQILMMQPGEPGSNRSHWAQNCNALPLELFQSYTISTVAALGWVGGSLSQRLWQVLMMQEAAASHWTRECSAWKSLKCNNYKWIPKIFSPASDNTHLKCFFLLHMTWRIHGVPGWIPRELWDLINACASPTMGVWYMIRMGRLGEVNFLHFMPHSCVYS